MNIKITDSDLVRKRAINDILRVYYSEAFNSVKSTTLRVIDLLYDLGYYEDSETIFIKEQQCKD